MDLRTAFQLCVRRTKPVQVPVGLISKPEVARRRCPNAQTLIRMTLDLHGSHRCGRGLALTRRQYCRGHRGANHCDTPRDVYDERLSRRC